MSYVFYDVNSEVQTQIGYHGNVWSVLVLTSACYCEVRGLFPGDGSPQVLINRGLGCLGAAR